MFGLSPFDPFFISVLLNIESKVIFLEMLYLHWLLVFQYRHEVFNHHRENDHSKSVGYNIADLYWRHTQNWNDSAVYVYWRNADKQK